MCFRRLIGIPIGPEPTTLWQTYYVVIRKKRWLLQTKNGTLEILECFQTFLGLQTTYAISIILTLKIIISIYHDEL